MVNSIDKTGRFGPDKYLPYQAIRQSKYYLHGLERKFDFNYSELLRKQRGCCAICLVDVPGYARGNKALRHFVVDHNHITNKVRGLLCKRCNTVLGFVEDNPNLLKRAIEYLETNDNIARREPKRKLNRQTF